MKIFSCLIIFILFITISITGYAQPIISTNPNSFNVTLGCNDSITQNLVVNNTGSATLSFSSFFKYAYVCNTDDNTVSVIDVTTNSIVGAPIPVGQWPMQAEISRDAQYVYITARDENNVYVIQTSSNTVVDTIVVGYGSHGLAFTPDGNFLYVCNQYDNNVSVIDCSNNTVISTINDLGFSDPFGACVSPDGSIVYIANRNSGITVIDVPTNTVITNILGFVRPLSIVFTPDGKFAFISEASSFGSVVKVDVKTNTILKKIGLFDQAVGIDITPDGKHIYAVDKGNAYIKIIEVSSGNIVDSIYNSSLNGGWGLAISPDGIYAYVGITWSSPSIIIIDLSTNLISGTLTTSTNGSWGVATLNNVPSWITSGIISDTIPAGNSANINFEFNSTGISTGIYSYNLTVFSNDLINPQKIIPCTLTVDGPPSMVLSDTCLYFDTVYVTGYKDKTLKIFNNGCDTLKVTGLTPTAQFTVSSSSLIVLPYDSAVVTVRFSPSATGNINGTIAILTNDYNTSICLKGFGKLPPDISVFPSSLSATAIGCVGDTITKLLTIYNSGFDNLACNITMDQGTYDSTSFVQYFISDAITNHIFPISLNPDSIYIRVIINGDYDSGSESANLYIDGTLIETIPDGNLLETDIINDYAFGGIQLDNWLSNNQIIVTLDNTSGVGAFGSTDYHSVQLWYNGVQWPGMINPSPSQVYIIPGDSATVSVDFISTGKNTGVYSTYMFIVSNDPDTPVDSIPCTLTVIGNPEITLSDTCLNFPSAQLGLSSSDTVLISNTGCDTLFITAISVSPAVFTFNPVSLPITIQPGSNMLLPVIFTPAVAQVYSGNLSVTSNAGNKNICLNGTGLPSAIINLIPDTLNVTLAGCNDSITVPLGIYNSGSVNLNYTISSFGTQPPTGYCIPTYNSMCSSADYINRFTFNTLSKLNSGCNGAANNYIFDQSVTTKVLPGSSYTMTMQAGSSYNQGFGVWIDYNRDGDFADAGEFVYASPSASTALFTTNITIPVNAPLGNTMLRVRCRYNNTVGASDYCTNFSYGETEDYGISIGDIFVTCSPTSGTSLSNDTSFVNVKFKSNGLASGMHSGFLTISSNDPVNPLVNLPFFLNVIGAPDISVSSSSLNFGSVFQYATKTDSITVTNSGCSNMTISNITNSNSAFSVDSTNFSVSPWSSEKIRITFNPQIVGNHYDTLIILNNDSIVKISLFGYSQSPPVIAYSPSSFNVTTANCNDSITLPLTIYNTGDTDLIFSLSGANVGDFNLDVALAGSETTPYLDDVRNKLLATGKFNSVTILDVRYATPTLTTLLQYDAVLVWMNYNYNNSTALGNVMADYADNGGGVVSAIFETGSSNHMLGRWDSQQYYVITRGSNASGYTTLGTVSDSGHPIMKNVVSLNGYNSTYRPNNTSLTPASTLVASWADGKPLVAFKEKNGNRLVDLGLWPPSSDVGANSWQSSTNGALLMANALEWASKFNNWLSVSTESDTIAAGDSVTVNVTFNTSNIITGNYSSALIINSNDPLSSSDTVLCNLTLNGYPTIALSDTCINFGSVMQWTQKTDSVNISNTGCDTLFVSDITLINNAFSVNTTNLVIPPDDDVNVLITFSPVTAGIFSDTLSVFNNDVLVKVCLNAISYSPPVIAYSPSSFNVTTANCNDSITLPLTIYNTGDTDLIFSLSGGNVGGFNLDVAIAGSEGNATYLNDVRSKLLATGKFNSVTIVDVRNSTPTLATLQQYDAVLVWMNSNYNNTTQLGNILADYVDNGGGVVSAIFETGYSGHLLGRWDTQQYYVITRGTFTSGYTTLGTVFDPGHPIMKNVVSLNGNSSTYRPNNTALTSNSTLIARWADGKPLVAVKEMNGARLADLGMWPPSSDVGASSWASNTNGGLLMANALEWVSEFVSWLAVSVETDTIAAGDSAVVNVTFNTTDLITGNYSASLVINSNDPLSPSDTILCNLTLNGHPTIALSDTCINFSSVMQWTSKTDSINILNTGCDTLFVTDITLLNSAFSVNTTNIVIPPDGDVNVFITFSPVTAGIFSDTLSVFNNDVLVKVCLNAISYSPPVLAYFPDSLVATVNICNDSVTLPLTIYNPGDTILNWNTDIINNYPKSSLNLTGGNYVSVPNYTGLPSGSVMTVEAWVYPVGLPDANYNGVVAFGPRACTGTSFLLSMTNAGRPSFASWCKDFVPTTGPTATLNQWHHIAAVLNGSSIKLYLDGYEWSGSLGTAPNVQPGTLTIGCTDLPGRYFNGRIDEVRIWNQVRTAQQINDLQNISLNSNSTGLVSYWNFNEGFGSTVADRTGNGHTGNLIGAGWSATGPQLSNMLFGSTSGSIPAGDSTTVNVTFNTSSLISGTYYESLIINSNDPLNGADTIPSVLYYNGYPVIATSDNCLEYDSLFQFLTVIDTLWISNNGCATLDVTNISNSLSAFTIDTTAFNVLPGDSERVIVTFNPQSVGHYYDTLHVFNNDSVINICLHGYALSPPVISLNPDSFYVTINNCNDSVTLPLTISNIGDTTLTWNIISQLNSGSALSFNGSSNYVLIPNSNVFDVTRLTMEAWVFSNNYNQNGFIFEKGPVNSQYSMFFEGGNFCFRTINSSGSMHSQYVSSSSIGFTNGSWHHVACTYDGTNKKIYVDGVLKNTLAYNQILRTGMQGQIIGAYGGTGGHSYYLNGRIDEVRVWNYARTATEISQSLNYSLIGNESGLIGYWNFNEGSGTTLYDLTNYNHDGTITGANWVTSGASVQDNIQFNTYSGNIIASDSILLNVTFYRNNQLSSTYQKQIVIQSNDPLSPYDTIPCTLVFTNNPVIDVSKNCLQFDSIFQYLSTKDSLWISNRGCDTLYVNNITNSQNEFSLNATTFTIIPGDSAKVVVTFYPLTLGHFYDTLLVLNNDSNINICLHGYALSPPVISFNPDSVIAVVNVCNDSVTVPLTIYNTGDTTLTYNIAAQTVIGSGYAIKFDGVNDYSDMGNWFNYQTFSIEMWVNPGSTQLQYADIIDNNHTGARSWVLQQNSTATNQYGWGANDGGGSALFNLNANQWTHIAITRDGVTRINRVYINGTLFSSYTGTGNVPYDGSQFFRLGRWGGGGRYWNGTMDEVRVWNTVRSQQQIAQNMDFQLSGSETGLLAYWNIETGSGTSIADISGNGRTGTISGGALWTTQDAPLENILTVGVNSGSIIAGDSAVIDLTFYTNDIYSGTYYRDIIISSNDPLSPVDTVPCTLIYNGYPLISLSDTCLNFDTIMQWESNSQTLIIRNTGCDILQITEITSSLNVFSISDTSFSIVPGDSSVLTVFFNPITIDTFSTNLIISTNIGSQSVCLNAVSTPPPVISVSPDSMNVTLTICNDSAVFPFTIYNSGSVALNYNINAFSNIAASLNNYIDTIASGDSSVVNLIIDGTTVNAGTYNFPIEINSNDPLNPFVSIPVTFTVTARPSRPVASDTSICDGDIVPDLFAAGTNVNWFNDTALVFSGNTYSSGDTAIGIYNYYVTQTIDNCESFADTVTLAIYAIPPAPNSSDNTICYENPNALLTAVGSNILWYGDSLLANQVAAGNNFLTGLASVGIYTFYLTQTVNNCQSPWDVSVLTINPIPTAPVVFDTTICFGNPTPDLITSGENIQWYSDSTLLNLIHIGDTLSTGITAAGVYIFYATQTSIAYNCQSHASASVLTIDSLFFPPVVTDNSICFGQTTPAFNSTGDSIRWYSDSLLITLVGTGNSYLPDDTLVGNYTYYLTQNNQCGESTFEDATLIIYPIPSAPVSSDQSVCFGYNIPDLVATGTNIIWYADSLLSNTVFAGNNYATGQSNVGNYIYYFTQTINNCESPANVVSLEIRPTPQIPTVSDTAICFGYTTPDLSATGANVQWYSDFALNLLVYTGNVFSTGNTASGIYVYYVTDLDTVAACESFSDSIKLIINPIPSAPVVADQTICFDQSVSAITSSGVNVTWYSDTNIVHAGNTYTPSEISVGIYNYLVTQTVNNCESPADTMIFTINPIPSAPSVYDTVICTVNPIPDLIALGTNIRWYSDSNLINLVHSGDTLVPGVNLAGVYNWYVTQTFDITGCEGPYEIATLTIDSLPQVPVADDYTICYGTPTPVFNTTGSNVNWYADSLLITFLYNGNNYASPDTAIGTYTYYVSQVNNCGGSSPDTAVLVINANPSAPVGTGNSVCFGSSVPPLTASGATVIWYQDSALTLVLDTTNSYNSGMTNVGTYLYYITLSQNNCQGPSDTVILEIRNIPSVPVSSNEVICFGTATPDLTATGVNVNWYENPSLDTIVSTGNIYSTGITAAGSYTFYVTQFDNGTSCESFADTVTLSINAIPASPVTADMAICFGQTSPSLLAAGSNIIWYSDSNIVNTGNTYIPVDTASGTYNFFVTQTVNNCESPADTVIFTINILPLAPVVSDTNICSGSLIPDLIAQGLNINWYSDSALTTLVYSGDTLSPGVTISGIYNWYVTQTISTTGCEGPYSKATLTIDSLPFKPFVIDQTICFGTATPSFIATGTNVIWYSDSAQTNLLQTGNTYQSTEDTVGFYVYFVTQSNYCGESEADSVMLTINAIPLPPDASGYNICFGQPTQTINATGSNIVWYMDSALTIPLDTANSYNPNLLAQGTYTFYLTQTVNSCQSSADTAIVNIYALPLPPLANDQYTCTSTVPPLIASGTNIQWYDSSGFVYTGDTLNTGLTQYGIYTYYATQINLVTGCESNRDTVLLTISTVITSPPGTNDTASCFGQTVPDLVAQGINIHWYADSILTLPVDSGNIFVTGNSIAGTYTYWVVQQNICGNSPKSEATLTINALPATPLSNDTSTCKGIPLALSATGINIQWYQDINLSTLLFNGNNFIPNIWNLPGTYTYYLTDSSLVTRCISYVDSLVYTVKDVPLPPVAGNEVACFGGIIPDLIAVGVNINWYDDSLLTNLINSNDTLVTGQTSLGTYTYYLTQSNECGASAKDSATLIIGNQPEAPVATSDSACFGSSNPSLDVIGTNINWYSDTALTQLDTTGNSYIPIQTAVGTYTWYVTQTTAATGCISDYTPVSLVISNIPGSPVTSDYSVCEGSANPALFASGSNITWYKDTALTLVVHNDSLFTPTDTLVGIYNYYTTQTVNSCESPSSLVVFTIKTLPSTPVSMDSSICEGELNPLFTSVGSNLTWYSDTVLSTVVSTGLSYQPVVNNVGVYNWYVTQNLNGCEGPYDIATYTINAIPAAPVSIDDTICYGANVPVLYASGSNVIWYSNQALTDTLQTGNNYQPTDTSAGTHIFYITQTINNCRSNSNDVIFLVFDSSQPPAASDNSVCMGAPSTLTASGVNVNWYSDASLTNLIYSGNTLTTNDSLPGTYIYYATQTVLTCGISPADEATLTVMSIPQAPDVNDVKICFGNPVPALVATGSNLKWYSEPELVILVNVGSSFNTGNYAVGSYVYYITQSINGCVSAVSNVVLTINPTPLVTLNKYYANIPEGGSVTLIAYNAANYSWTPVTGLSSATGSIVVASPLQTTTYIVTGTSNQGCADTARCVVEVGEIGIIGNDLTQYLSVYPNPTSGNLNIMFVAAQKESITIRFMNQLSQVLINVQSEQINGKFEETISLENIADGVYYLQIMAEKGVITKKIVLRR